MNNKYYESLKEFIKTYFVAGIDYAYTSDKARKPSLTKAGAEKLFKHFLGVLPKFEIQDIYNDRENFVYEIIIKASVVIDGQECQAWGSYSTAEKTKLDVDGLKREYFKGKNSCIKMAQKRALVALALIVTATSEFYTQDLEDEIKHEQENEEKFVLIDKINTCDNLPHLRNIWKKYSQIIKENKEIEDLIKEKSEELKREFINNAN
jgi:hypothetical protein